MQDYVDELAKYKDSLLQCILPEKNRPSTEDEDELGTQDEAAAMDTARVVFSKGNKLSSRD